MAGAGCQVQPVVQAGLSPCRRLTDRTAAGEPSGRGQEPRGRELALAPHSAGAAGWRPPRRPMPCVRRPPGTAHGRSAVRVAVGVLERGRCVRLDGGGVGLPWQAGAMGRQSATGTSRRRRTATRTRRRRRRRERCKRGTLKELCTLGPSKPGCVDWIDYRRAFAVPLETRPTARVGPGPHERRQAIPEPP